MERFHEDTWVISPKELHETGTVFSPRGFAGFKLKNYALQVLDIFSIGHGIQPVRDNPLLGLLPQCFPGVHRIAKCDCQRFLFSTSFAIKFLLTF